MRCDTISDAAEQEPGKRRADAGFLSLIAAVSVVSGALIYSMSGSNPYWRLLQVDSVPAPAYEAPSQMASVMPTAQPEPSNPDTAAASPGQGKPDAGLSRVMTDDVAGAARLPDPELAQVPALEDGQGDVAVVMAGLAPVVAAVPAAMTGPQALEDVDFARPDPLAPVRGRLSDPFGASVADLALTPFAQPAPPAQPRVAATEMTEEALALEHRQRIDVQRRLALAGFNPRGVDGTFGPNTRGAIADFQTAWGFPATGYLDDAVYADLNQRTEAAYQAMRRRAMEQPAAAPALAAVLPAERGDKCARSADGRIIERQSLSCDLAGMAEQFVTMGRSSLDSEEDVGVEPTAAADPVWPVLDNDR